MTMPRGSALALLLLIALCRPASGETVFRIAAASNLSGTLDRIAEAFAEANPGVSAEIAYGSSGALSAQIRGGAPFDLFLSADRLQPERLAADGFAAASADPVRVYALGVLCVASRLGVDASGRLGFLSGAVYRSIAVARPEIAPYGAAAVAALGKSGVYAAVESRLVYGTNIGQVVRFVGSGAADAGFVNLSALILDPDLAAIPWARVDPALYPPIEQAGIVLKPSDGRPDSAARLSAARAFLSYLTGGEGADLLRIAGYGTPGTAR